VSTVWEVTTAHGTRIILDPGEESRWMRIPTIGDDGRLNLHSLDGRWRRLMTAYPLDETRAPWGGFDIGVHERWTPRRWWRCARSRLRRSVHRCFRRWTMPLEQGAQLFSHCLDNLFPGRGCHLCSHWLHK
jgi:hypothetical protein